MEASKYSTMSDAAEESNEIRTEKWPLDLSIQSSCHPRAVYSECWAQNLNWYGLRVCDVRE